MSPRRNGEGPTRTDENGATVKTTFTGRDRCFIGSCPNVPKHTITLFGRQVRVCTAHESSDGIH